MHSMHSLGQTGVHYVRCVKPNPRSAASDFDAPYVAAYDLRQIRNVLTSMLRDEPMDEPS